MEQISIILVVKVSKQQVGSLRDVSKSVAMLPGHLVAGGRIREHLLLYFADKPLLPDQCCDALGTDCDINQLFPPCDVSQLRQEIQRLIQSNWTGAGFPKEEMATDLQGPLLSYWAFWAGDPAAEAAKW